MKQEYHISVDRVYSEEFTRVMKCIHGREAPRDYNQTFCNLTDEDIVMLRLSFPDIDITKVNPPW